MKYEWMIFGYRGMNYRWMIFGYGWMCMDGWLVWVLRFVVMVVVCIDDVVWGGDGIIVGVGGGGSIVRVWRW